MNAIKSVFISDTDEEVDDIPEEPYTISRKKLQMIVTLSMAL